MGLCTTGLRSANAQESKTIIFDAPGADLTPGDYNGTYSSGINALGVIAGSYQGVDTVFHGFVRRPDGQFTTFEAPGADTIAGSYNGTSPSSINDLGVITGSFYDASGLSHGFLRTPDGRFTTFDVPGAGENRTFPIGLISKEPSSGTLWTQTISSMLSFALLTARSTLLSVQTPAIPAPPLVVTV